MKPGLNKYPRILPVTTDSHNHTSNTKRTTHPERPKRTKRPKKTPWAAVLTLALGIFTIVTLEQLPIGVLTLIAEGLHTSDATIGLGVTIPGILAGLCAAFVPKLSGHLDRRIVLASAMFAAAISAAASALAPTAVLFLASRIIIGFAIGIFWALLGSTAAAIAAPGELSKALTLAFSGAAGAVVLGVPLSTWLGALLGWHGAFLSGGILAALVGLTLLFVLPPVPATGEANLTDLKRALNIRGVRYGVCFTLILVTSHFLAYTYASPILQDLGGISAASVGTMLLIYGCAGLIGNFLAAPILNRSIRVAVALLPIGLLSGMLALSTTSTPIGAALTMAFWGIFGGGMSVISLGWVMNSAGRLTEPASALNSSAFNIGIACGALIGGLFETLGSASVLLAAAVGMGFAALLGFFGARRV